MNGTEVSYSEYRYDGYGGTERTCERSLYPDPSRAIVSERCRNVVQRGINGFGEEIVRRDRVCGPLGEIETAEPWERQVPRWNGYPSHVQPPPEDIPYVD